MSAPASSGHGANLAGGPSRALETLHHTHFAHAPAVPMTEGKMYKLLSFDVYGTLVNTPPANAKAFQAILKDAGATNIDPVAFCDFWESRNVAQYWKSYRSYKAICRTSLEDAFAHFKVAGADPS